MMRTHAWSCLIGFISRLSDMLTQAASVVGGVLARAKAAPASWRPTLPEPNRQAVGLVALAVFAGGLAAAAPDAEPNPLLDWSVWKRHFGSVRHPALVFKAAEVARARENARRYGWAKSYVAGVDQNARRHLARLTPAFLANMIPATTPGDPLWTPCPACREQGKPVHPHGLWNWTVDRPDELQCTQCRTVFPNEKYPEDIVLTTKWRQPQTITFCGGETFVIFGYKTGRPSFTANIRARKVQWIAGAGRTLAEAHLLTGQPEFARACREILLRFADRYPSWLVHVGYGEYADMDPRIAARQINQLPEPELCPPPNQPDRRLHTGYWSAGRAGGVGMESGFVRQVAEAYDWACSAEEADGRPIFSDADRRKIERDLLLESTILLVCDKQINNKSVSNRTAAALVGMCVGHPELVRFGLEGFLKAVDGWFLPDGTTSESPTYGTMTLGGIWDFAEAFRGYRDPPDYRDAVGLRIDARDLYHDSAYARVWECFFRGLQGDLRFPPYADSWPTASLGANFLELMARNYPERPHYLSLLKETLGGAAAVGGDATRQDLLKELPGSGLAIYVREPGLEQRSAPPLSLADWCSPDLRIGHLRTGADGRESLLTLSASHWGNHHHQDSLNLYYWKQGHELLSDLGYLWDHPLKSMTMRTVAHNTVVLDESNQVTKERGGEVLLFKTSDRVKMMEASSRAYPQAKLYRRTMALVDHGGGQSYAVDFFRVAGGRRQDYVYHAAGATCDVLGLNLQPVAAEKLYDFTNVRAADAPGVWRTTWPCGGNMAAVAWNVGQPGERALIADGWGQRDWKNSDIGATIPYVVRRCEGGGARTFISVFEGHAGKEPFVRNVTLVDPAGVLRIETALGQDYVMSMSGLGTLRIPTSAGEQAVAGHFAIVAVQDRMIAWSVVEESPPAGIKP
jgi:hypothetical protein